MVSLLRFLGLISLTTGLALPAQAEDDTDLPTVRVLSDCPVYGECVQAAIVRMCPENAEICIAAETESVRIEQPFIGIDIVQSNMRFSGKEEIPHQVRFTVGEDGCGGYNSIAFLGFSKNGNPMVMTENGEAELSLPGFQMVDENRVVIDVAAKKVLHTYLTPGYNKMRFLPDGRAVYNERGSCFFAIEDGDGVLVRANPFCEAYDAENTLLPAGVEPAQEGDVELALELFPILDVFWGGDAKHLTHRITDSDNLILVDFSAPCT